MSGVLPIVLSMLVHKVLPGIVPWDWQSSLLAL